MSVEVRSKQTIGADHFKVIVDQAPSAMLAVDRDARLVLLNNRAEKIFGVARNQLLGLPVTLLAPPEQRQQMRWILMSPMESRPAKAVFTTTACRQDGHEMMLELEPVLIEVDDTPIILSSVVDITRRQMAEARSEAAFREKSLLVSEIHHRVKNNLQIVCSLLELQKARVSDPQLIDILSDSTARVVSMALIHQAICQAPNVAQVSFGHFLEMLIARLREVHGAVRKQLAFQFEAIELQMTMDRAMPCGLAVNELLANSLRHSVALQQGLKVALYAPNESTGCVSLQCLGSAPTSQAAPVGERDFSLQLIELLVAQARGKIAMDAQPGGSWEFTFPLHATSENG